MQMPLSTVSSVSETLIAVVQSAPKMYSLKFLADNSSTV